MLKLKLEARPVASRLWVYASPVLALLITVIIGVALFAFLGKDRYAPCRSFSGSP